MSATTMVHVRVDECVKVQASEALEAMGLTVSDAVRAFLTRVATEKQIPFALRVPNAKTRAAMAESEAIMKARTTRFRSGPDMFDALAQEASKR